MLKFVLLMAVFMAVVADPLALPDEPNEDGFTVQSADEISTSRDELIKAIYENVLKQLASEPTSNDFQQPADQFNEPEGEESPAQPADSKERPSFQVVPASIYKPMYTAPYPFANYMRQPSYAGPYRPSFYNSYSPSSSFYQPPNPYSAYPFYMRQRPMYPYHQPMFNPYRQFMYSPYHQPMFSPYRQSMFSPYHQPMFSPYRQSMYSPYHQSMYSPYHQPMFSPFRQTMYNPYTKYQAGYYHPVTGMPYLKQSVSVVRPYSQKPYQAIASPSKQFPYDDNVSEQEAMHPLEAMKGQEQYKPQRTYPSLSLPYSYILGQPDSMETVNNLSRISALYSQVADALSSEPNKKQRPETIIIPVTKPVYGTA